jgi:hypothetical protein
MLKLHDPEERRESLSFYAVRLGSDSWLDFVARRVSVGVLADDCLTGSYAEAAQARDGLGWPLCRGAKVVRVDVA